ncbi:phage tail protein [Microbulbifer variabilis]|uniref:Phage tail protein n=1 Tax=Microbulbifer variabilis TaxID=266805 RepID=A0ABY4V6C0_9GAMM|nr:phage tail protein [Microbulbifer variabilis]USD19773.1 phage tail protein [Microbulbifer variabilis]
MALEKLRAITGFLLGANLVSCEQLDSWMEDGKLETTSKNLGNGICICRLRYDAVISIERFAESPELLFALVTAWVQDQDAERVIQELPDPEIEIDVINEHKADVEIRIAFYEDIQLVPDDNGVIPYNGRQWSIATVGIDEPNQVGVGDSQSQPTDAPFVRKD